MRLTIDNHWDPVAKRWRIDKGDRVDIGTTAVPNSVYSGALVTDAGEDFAEVDVPQNEETAPS